MGVKTVTGTTWESGTINGMLCNEKYKEDFYLQKYYTPENKRNHTRKNNGEVQSYYISENHEPIVSPEVWEKVQEVREQRKRDRNIGQHNEVPKPLSLKWNADLPLLRKNTPAQTGLQEENIMTKRRLRCIINKQKALTEGDDGMASSSMLLYKIKFEQEYHIDEIINRIENDILDETRIVVEDYTETSLSGIYIYAEIYKSQEYNFQINNFEIITRKKYVVTEFHIDMKNNYMDIWGTVQNAQKIITSISLAFDNHIVIEALEMKFTRMIEYLSKEEGIYVGKVTARQVVLNDGLLADCTLDLSCEEMPFETIDKYKKNIQKISFRWKCTESIIRMVIHMSGTVTIYKARRMIKDNELECIYKMLLYAGGN